MIASLAMCLALVPIFGQVTADARQLEKLASKVKEIGQTRPIDKQIGKFFKFEKLEVTWHSKFDSEREVQVCEFKKIKYLILLAPEKPFPEFGKVRVYSVSFDGKQIVAGVSDMREDFVGMTDKKAIKEGLMVEINYWTKELAIKD